jgi:DNA-directed RNA polymerase subunit RPC12/RpoP
MDTTVDTKRLWLVPHSEDALAQIEEMPSDRGLKCRRCGSARAVRERGRVTLGFSMVDR